MDQAEEPPVWSTCIRPPCSLPSPSPSAQDVATDRVPTVLGSERLTPGVLAAPWPHSVLGAREPCLLSVFDEKVALPKRNWSLVPSPASHVPALACEAVGALGTQDPNPGSSAGRTVAVSSWFSAFSPSRERRGLGQGVGGGDTVVGVAGR